RVVIKATSLTLNAAPVANAGIDQSVTTSTTVTLNGTKSSDANGDQLSYRWSFVSKPSSSTATLANSSSSTPFFTADKDGSYVVQLIVNDGKADSNPDRVSIIASTNVPTPITGQFTLLAWNDLGMHCFDGKDFSIFSILPPYNNLNAQLITKEGTSDKHITSGVTITYEALAYDGHINTTSEGKTNFWNYVQALFPGADPRVNVGLTGYKTPSETPQPLSYNSGHQWWEADGIPIVSYDDENVKNFYPMVKVTAKSGGTTLATVDVVLPVSDEMDCAKCHASTATLDAAKPAGGWVEEADALKNYKLNILRLHDEKRLTDGTEVYDNAITALKTAGYDYNNSLESTANNGTPILCATCHKSNALGTSGFDGIKPLTQALHGSHATAIDPSNSTPLGDSRNRTACYSCHPGAETECLRGAMGSAKDTNNNQIMQCQSCHGTMSDVGSANREGWLDQPNCQVCHQNGERYESALVNGTLRAVVDTRFATNPNTPMNGKSLYRYSTGHGNLQCSACHGSTHAIFPTSHAQDNIASTQIQGHSGTIGECTACHSTTPNTTAGGPHGMHPVGSSWVHDHEHVAERNSAQCATCHGNDYRGSVLSKTFAARSFNADGHTENYIKGQMVTCYDCHNGPNGGDDD
ncbi:MAG: hypothetical protein RL113_1297, partial [Pseudomonadota bacterium]